MLHLRTECLTRFSDYSWGLDLAFLGEAVLKDKCDLRRLGLCLLVLCCVPCFACYHDTCAWCKQKPLFAINPAAACVMHTLTDFSCAGCTTIPQTRQCIAVLLATTAYVLFCLLKYAAASWASNSIKSSILFDRGLNPTLTGETRLPHPVGTSTCVKASSGMALLY